MLRWVNTDRFFPATVCLYAGLTISSYVSATYPYWSDDRLLEKGRNPAGLIGADRFVACKFLWQTNLDRE
jgi:hypothetical protein